MASFELSPEEIEIIESWYLAAAGESAVDQEEPCFALLEKLGIEATGMHLVLTDLEHVYPEYRAEYQAKNDAVKAYCARHPDYESVREMMEE